MESIRRHVVVVALGILISIGPLSVLDPADAQLVPTTALDAHHLLIPGSDSVADHSKALEEQYRRVWAIVRDNYLHQERLGDWLSWEHRYDGSIQSSDRLYAVLRQMLESLHDDYTYFRNPAETDAHVETHRTKNVVWHRMLANQIGYLAIDTFCSDHVISETRSALEDLAQARAYVLDLRGNRGGCIDEASAVFAMIVSEGKFTTMRGRAEGEAYDEDLLLSDCWISSVSRSDTLTFGRQPNLTGDKPVMVLVNGQTRSAAEMLAGAIRENKRGQLLGTRTFGKGIVQTIWSFPDGTSVKMATARWFLPSGQCIEGTGLDPDFLVSRPGDKDVQLARAAQILHDKLCSSSKYSVTARR